MSEEILAEALRCVVHRGGGALHVRGAEQADCPVPQILSLQEYEDHKENDNARGSQRRQYSPCNALKKFKGPGRRLTNLDRDRLTPLFCLLGQDRVGADFRFWLRVGELAFQALYRFGGLLQRRGTGRRFAKCTDFFGEHVLIAG